MKHTPKQGMTVLNSKVPSLQFEPAKLLECKLIRQFLQTLAGLQKFAGDHRVRVAPASVLNVRRLVNEILHS